MTAVPITVFAGFLGAGKTTIILEILSQIGKECKIAIIKNEFGDIQVDSKLFQQSINSDIPNVGSNLIVQEMLNGCLCCVLVGQLKNAILDLKSKIN